jgi:hypothetical protein
VADAQGRGPDPWVDTTAAPTVERRADQRFRIAAAGLFALMAAVVVVAGCVVSANTESWQVVPRLAILAALPAGAVIVAIAWGLIMERPWAEPPSVVLLWLFVVSGVIDVLASLTRGSLTIPLAAIAAAILLWQRPPGFGRASLAARDRWLAAGLAGVYIASIIWPYALAVVAGPSAA